MKRINKLLSKKLVKYFTLGIVTQCLIFASFYALGANTGASKEDKSVTTEEEPKAVMVTGKVTSSEDGLGIPGVNVVIKKL